MSIDTAMPPRLIAVDWGTTRFRAFLLNGDGEVLETRTSDDGIAALGGAGHAAVFERECGPWIERNPNVFTILGGMVGSRNGWVEAPYAPLPAGLQEVVTRAVPVALPTGGQGLVIPGLIGSDPMRSDVMRGEETKILGAVAPRSKVEVLCLPGTHAKWAVVENGRVTRFRTFVTGEMFGLLREHSFIASLAKGAAHDPAAFERGMEAAQSAEGLLGAAFMARTSVLDGRLAPSGVAAFLSGLLIRTELDTARSLFQPDRVTLVSTGDLAGSYTRAAAHARLKLKVVDATAAFLTGIVRFARAAGLGVSRH
jgi:2-dehydro-3-deoxygalactonokinase